MKKLKSVVLLWIIFSATTFYAKATTSKPTGSYRQVVEGFDWGPAVNKVILTLEDTTSSVSAGEYVVLASRKSAVGEIAKEQSSGQRSVVFAYVSDEHGGRIKVGKYITLVLAVGPNLPIGSPIQYFRGKGNQWVDYQLSIINNRSQQVWDNSIGKIMPLVDQFNLQGKYTHNESLTMSYASYAPNTKKEKSPLIIWLHGGGEGGVDPTIPLIGK